MRNKILFSISYSWFLLNHVHAQTGTISDILSQGTAITEANVGSFTIGSCVFEYFNDPTMSNEDDKTLIITGGSSEFTVSNRYDGVDLSSGDDTLTRNQVCGNDCFNLAGCHSWYAKGVGSGAVQYDCRLFTFKPYDNIPLQTSSSNLHRIGWIKNKDTCSLSTTAPTDSPTAKPTLAPTTKSPTKAPTQSPVEAQTTKAPTTSPVAPTDAPTKAPTQVGQTPAPTNAPTTKNPTNAPITPGSPTDAPTNPPAPTRSPVSPTSSPDNDDDSSDSSSTVVAASLGVAGAAVLGGAALYLYRNTNVFGNNSKSKSSKKKSKSKKDKKKKKRKKRKKKRKRKSRGIMFDDSDSGDEGYFL